MWYHHWPVLHVTLGTAGSKTSVAHPVITGLVTIGHSVVVFF